MTDLSQVTLVIPAYNEEASLPLVLADLPEVGRVIVVNNASTDGTAAVAQRCGATLVDEPRRGYGSACLCGLAAIEEFIADGEEPPRVVAFLDADYSDHPETVAGSGRTHPRRAGRVRARLAAPRRAPSRSNAGPEPVGQPSGLLAYADLVRRPIYRPGPVSRHRLSIA